MYQQGWSHFPVARSGAWGFTFGALRACAAQRRREQIWAWVSLVLLLLCWDASSRLDEKVSMPRPKLGHMVELEIEGRPRIEGR